MDDNEHLFARAWAMVDAGALLSPRDAGLPAGQTKRLSRHPALVARRNAKMNTQLAVRREEGVQHFAPAIRRLFPSMPEHDVIEVAERVGGHRATDDDTVTRAVAAHARHAYTTYDDTYGGFSRLDGATRRRINRNRVSYLERNVLDRWREPKGEE